jgi:hypothetical protein
MAYKVKGYRMQKVRSAMAMIELIFAIVIIAISILTIPTVVTIAGNASNVLLLQENIVYELSRVANDKFQARFDGRYANMGSLPLRLNPDTGDLNCNASGGTSRIGYNVGTATLACEDVGITPSAIPAVAGSGTGQADGNVSRGIEMLNSGTETLSIANTALSINASYHVRYVNSSATVACNTVTAQWKLG